VGNAPSFQRDLIQTLLDGRRQYGDVVRFPGVGPLFPVYLVSHPDGVKHVLQDHCHNYPKTPFVNDRWRALVGNGLICSEGEFWRSQRRLVQPAFHRHLVTRLGEIMVDSTESLLQQWEAMADNGVEIELAKDMTRLALDVLGRACFDAEWQRDADAMSLAVHATIGDAYRRFGQVISIPDRVPTPANRRFAAARAELDGIIYRVVDERIRQRAPHSSDLLEALLTATDDGVRMSREQVRNEVMTFMFGGHETVASGLTWALVLLSRHPEVTRELEAEIDQVLGGRRPTVEDLESLPTVERVLKECLRLYPPVWLFSRTPVEDDVIAGHRIPAGAMVLLSPFVTHRNQEAWPNPEGFDPDRWLPVNSSGRHRFAWFPFSGGPRKCIGDQFGLQEMQIALTMIVQRLRIQLASGHPVVPQPGITLGHQHGVVVTALRRTAAPQPPSRGEAAAQSDAGPGRCPFRAAGSPS